jgi:hypothetical protein
MDDQSRGYSTPSKSAIAIRCRGQTLCWSLLCSSFLLSAAYAGPIASCKPILSIRDIGEIRSSELLPYAWTATVLADSRHCATYSGIFEVDFIRIKEFGPDVQFTEKFRWEAGAFEISVELWFDEAVLDYRIGFVAPCVCRDMPFD